MSQEKVTYIVSVYGLSGLRSVDKKFFHSHACAVNNGFNHKDSNVADFLDETEGQIEAGWDFVEDRYEKYIKLFSQRLNLIHETTYSIEFWRRAFSLGFLRNISAIHMFFDIAERYFDPNLHACKILPKGNYNYCNTFEEQREFLTSSWIGQEQLLSMYLECFFPDYFSKLEADEGFLDVSDAVRPSENRDHIKVIRVITTLKRYLKKLLQPNVVFRYLYRKINFLKGKKKITTAIMGSHFSEQYLRLLETESEGRIQPMPIMPVVAAAEINLGVRNRLFEVNPDADRFERFFFFASLYFFPTVLLESFQFTLRKCDRSLHMLPSLKYIVSEAWLSSTSINIFRAVAYESRGISTFYNEHNCIFHPFLDDYVNFESRLVDQYMTFGWKSPSRKFVSLGSLFPFAIAKSEAKYEILYVSYLAEQYRAIYSSVYGQAGYGAISHLNFAGKFFAALPLDVLRSIFYRGYPKDYYITGLRYDKESMLDPYLQHVRFVSASKTRGETCKEQMAASRLVVIDYLSTAYLESLMMNVPTVCFWDSDAMFLKDEYSDFYDDLIEAKIMHTSPESAASHLLNVYEDPSCWWHNSHTQMLRERWLSRNFGRPDSLVSHLLHLS